MTNNSNASLSPVRSISRKESVVQEIKRGIAVGAIKLGQKLTELELADSLGVSRPTIREAIQQLTREGILVQVPYKGIEVADVDAKDIMDLAILREALDLMTVQLIYADPTGDGLKQIEQAWEEYEELENHPDALIRSQAHTDFHRAIWSATNSQVVQNLLPVIEGLMTIALVRDRLVRQDPVRDHSIHEKYVAAILSGNFEKAKKEIHNTTVASAKELIALMK